MRPRPTHTRTIWTCQLTSCFTTLGCERELEALKKTHTDMAGRGDKQTPHRRWPQPGTDLFFSLTLWENYNEQNSIKEPAVLRNAHRMRGDHRHASQPDSRQNMGRLKGDSASPSNNAPKSFKAMFPLATDEKRRNHPYSETQDGVGAVFPAKSSLQETWIIKLFSFSKNKIYWICFSRLSFSTWF